MRNLINLTESFIDAEEGEMAKGQIAVMCHNIEELKDMIEDEDDLPEWVQNKLTLANDYIETIKDYMLGKEHDLDEATSSRKIKDMHSCFSEIEDSTGDMIGIDIKYSEHPTIGHDDDGDTGYDDWAEAIRDVIVTREDTGEDITHLVNIEDGPVIDTIVADMEERYSKFYDEDDEDNYRPRNMDEAEGDDELIAAFLAKNKAKVAPEGTAYGADPRAERAAREASKADAIEARRAAKAKPVRRNWAAQARYDNEHGTVNGFDIALQNKLALYNKER